MAKSKADKLRQEIEACRVVGAGYDDRKMAAAFRRAYGPFTAEKWVNLMREGGYSVFLYSDGPGKVPGVASIYPEGRRLPNLACPDIWYNVEKRIGTDVHRSVVEYLTSMRG